MNDSLRLLSAACCALALGASASPAAARQQFCAATDTNLTLAGIQPITVAQCNAAAVAGGGQHSVALKSDGRPLTRRVWSPFHSRETAPVPL